VNIVLDTIPLNYVNQPGKDRDIRSVTKIATSDTRSMVEHGIPGMEGNSFLNMGRNPVRIAIAGSFHGNLSTQNIERLRSHYRKGIPVTFISDITGAADVTKVLIKDFQVKEEPGIPGMYRYLADIVEFKDPPLEPGVPETGVAGAQEWMEQSASNTVESINCIRGRVLTSSGDPYSGARVCITGLSGELSATTNDQGIYSSDNVPPGTYRITVAEEGYDGIEKEIVVGPSGAPGQENNPPTDEDDEDSNDDTGEDEDSSEDTEDGNDDTGEDDESSEDTEDGNDDTGEDEDSSEDTEDSNADTGEDEDSSEDTEDSNEDTGEDEDSSEDTEDSDDDTGEDEESSEDTEDGNEDTGEDEESSEDTEDGNDVTGEDEE